MEKFGSLFSGLMLDQMFVCTQFTKQTSIMIALHVLPESIVLLVVLLLKRARPSSFCGA
jgi:hypothetical protein